MPKHFKNNVLNYWGNIKVINIFLSAEERLAPHVFMALRYSPGEEGLLFTLVLYPSILNL